MTSLLTVLNLCRPSGSPPRKDEAEEKETTTENVEEEETTKKKKRRKKKDRTTTTTTPATTTINPLALQREANCVLDQNTGTGYWAFNYVLPSQCYSEFYLIILKNGNS